MVWFGRYGMVSMIGHIFPWKNQRSEILCSESLQEKHLKYLKLALFCETLLLDAGIRSLLANCPNLYYTNVIQKSQIEKVFIHYIQVAWAQSVYFLFFPVSWGDMVALILRYIACLILILALKDCHAPHTSHCLNPNICIGCRAWQCGVSWFVLNNAECNLSYLSSRFFKWILKLKPLLARNLPLFKRASSYPWLP